ncbi:MAG: OsmC family protein [Christensenellaceae bacterium]|jgi:uncharacterized OsmC-like protein
MKATFRATAKKLKDGMQVETTARNFKIMVDEPKNLGGTDIAMNPVEALLCALGGCQVIVAASFAAEQGIDLQDFWVELEGDLDPAGFSGQADVRKGYEEIRYTMHFKTDAPKEKVEAFAAFIEERCPVGDTLQKGTALKLAGVVIE